MISELITLHQPVIWNQILQLSFDFVKSFEILRNLFKILKSVPLFRELVTPRYTSKSAINRFTDCQVALCMYSKHDFVIVTKFIMQKPSMNKCSLKIAQIIQKVLQLFLLVCTNITLTSSDYSISNLK